MTAGTIGVIVLVVGAAYGSWKFFQNVDEVEIADNLWGSLIGLYVYALLLPGVACNLLGQGPRTRRLDHLRRIDVQRSRGLFVSQGALQPIIRMKSNC